MKMLLTNALAELCGPAGQPAGAPDDRLTLSEIWGYGFMMPKTASGYFYLDRVNRTLGNLMFEDGFE